MNLLDETVDQINDFNSTTLEALRRTESEESDWSPLENMEKSHRKYNHTDWSVGSV